MPKQSGGETPQIRQLLESIRRWTHTEVSNHISDSVGVYCLSLQMERGDVYAVAKRYQYRDLASFPKRVARRAVDKGCPMAIFFPPHDVGDGYVYNPEYVLSEGIERPIQKAGQPRTLVFDIPIEDGVLYGDYISGREDLPEGEYHPPDQRFKID